MTRASSRKSRPAPPRGAKSLRRSGSSKRKRGEPADDAPKSEGLGTNPISPELLGPEAVDPEIVPDLAPGLPIDASLDPFAEIPGVPGEEDDGHPAGESEPRVETSSAVVRYDPLTRYLQEIRRFAPLDREEERRLARRFRDERDPEAAGRLVTANLELVVRIARMFRRAVRNMLDLIQEGNVGLIQALERFDPEQGVRFSTYAGFWVRAYILKFLLDNARMVRVGTTNSRRKLLYNLNREKRRLEEAGYTVGPKLLAERFGVTESEVVDVERSLSGPDLSLDAPIGLDGGTTRGDLLPAPSRSVEDEVAEREMQGLVQAKLAEFRTRLGERDAVIFDRRLLADEPATLQEIGDQFGITREAIRQTESRLSARLKEFLQEQLGEDAILRIRSKN